VHSMDESRIVNGLVLFDLYHKQQQPFGYHGLDETEKIWTAMFGGEAEGRSIAVGRNPFQDIIT
jgi:hypothetical protein